MAKERRPLSDEEIALWNRVAGTTVPLRRTQPLPIGPAKKQTLHSTPIMARAPRDAPGQAMPPVRGPGQIDRRTVRRIARGSIGLDARLDLHGLTQAKAHARLTEFVSGAQQDNLRTVLIITGKGVGDGTERGILKRALPQWLSATPLRNMVSGFDIARREHGGSGAFYVRIRRSRG